MLRLFMCGHLSTTFVELKVSNRYQSRSRIGANFTITAMAPRELDKYYITICQKMTVYDSTAKSQRVLLAFSGVGQLTLVGN